MCNSASKYEHELSDLFKGCCHFVFLWYQNQVFFHSKIYSRWPLVLKWFWLKLEQGWDHSIIQCILFGIYFSILLQCYCMMGISNFIRKVKKSYPSTWLRVDLKLKLFFVYLNALFPPRKFAWEHILQWCPVCVLTVSKKKKKKREANKQSSTKPPTHCTQKKMKC